MPYIFARVTDQPEPDILTCAPGAAVLDGEFQTDDAAVAIPYVERRGAELHRVVRTLQIAVPALVALRVPEMTPGEAYASWAERIETGIFEDHEGVWRRATGALACPECREPQREPVTEARCDECALYQGSTIQGAF